MAQPLADEEAVGRLIGIARRERHRAPMETLDRATVSVTAGIEGDSRGARYPRRQVTVLAVEDWADALSDLAAVAARAGAATPIGLHWTERRANLLVNGIVLPRGRGSLMRIGDVELEVTGETTPCARMDEAVAGLRRALAPHWRGGVTCRVLTGGPIALGDPAWVTSRIQAPVRRLPG
jgi:MOSC domain-containing protein YiiM